MPDFLNAMKGTPMDFNAVYHSNIPDFLLEFASADVCRRLDSVGMDCGCEYSGFPVFHDRPKATRYEHSLGVALIIWHFTRDIRQSVAGLLHDISTPVFAHTVDFLNNDHVQQESTEEKTEEIIVHSRTLQTLLQKYGLTTADVSDYHRYPIADNDSPQLSADRLEYTLRNLFRYGGKTEAEIRRYYEDLTVGQNEYGQEEILFKTKECAFAFTQEALALSRLYLSDPDRYCMQYLAETLKAAMEENILLPKDLHTTEREVLQKLDASPKTAAMLQKYRSFSTLKTAVYKPEEEGWFCIPAKKRYVDPLILNAGRVTACSPAIARKVCALQEIRFDYWIKALGPGKD